MLRRRRVPRELARARARRRRAPPRARRGSSSSSRTALGQRVDVAGGHDAPGAVRAHRLAEAGDVVDDRGHAGAERLQQRTRLVELGAVREDRDRRLRERAVELGLREVAEPPLDALGGRAGRRAASPGRPATSSRASGSRRVASIASGRPLYGRITPSDEQRRAVVGARRRARVDGVGDHARVDAELARASRGRARCGRRRGRSARAAAARGHGATRCAAAAGRAR